MADRLRKLALYEMIRRPIMAPIGFLWQDQERGLVDTIHVSRHLTAMGAMSED
jgi:hypothetical protein